MTAGLRAVQAGAVRERSAAAVALARDAQPGWARHSMPERLAVLRQFRDRLATGGSELAALIVDAHRGVADVLASEVLPLADACRYLERHAAEVLASRQPEGRGPLWLGRSDISVQRVPLGVVLVVGPGNYPLLLPGVQILQALAAGNAVLAKPAPGSAAVLQRFHEMLLEAGLPPHALILLDEDVDAVRGAVEARVDKVLLTGSADTGRIVMRQLAEQRTPAVMELSGCDAAFVLPDAEVAFVARALRFGMTLNGGRTCIAPRRAFVPASSSAALEAALQGELAGAPAVALDEPVARQVDALLADARGRGARVFGGTSADGRHMTPTLVVGADPDMQLMAADVFAPLLTLVAVADMNEALELDESCPYALGASVFGPRRAAEEIASRVRAGVVVINDVIVPTADPRVPFGGSGDSGFGLSRGVDGLLELTRARVVIRRPGTFRPHFDAPPRDLKTMLAGYLKTAHARSWRDRLAGLGGLLRAISRTTTAGPVAPGS